MIRAVLLLAQAAFGAYPTSTPNPVILVTETGGAPVYVATVTVSGTVTTSATATAGAMDCNQVSVSSSTSTTLLAANANRKSNPTICNESTVRVYLNAGKATTTANGQSIVGAVGACAWPEGPAVSTGTFTALSEPGSAGTVSVCSME